VTLTTATGLRPVTAPVTVTVSLGGAELGRFEAGRDWSEHSVQLPDPLPSGPPVLRLDVPTFRPMNVLPGATDARDLGVMVDRIRLGSGLPGADATIAVSRPAGGTP
jgi:hypothetical protein